MIFFIFCHKIENHYFQFIHKIEKNENLTDLIVQLFPMTPYIVLIEIKVVRNYVINNFKLHDQLSRTHSFHSKSLWSWQNSAISQKKSFFGQLYRLLVRKRCIFRSWSWYSKLFSLHVRKFFPSCNMKTSHQPANS